MSSENLQHTDFGPFVWSRDDRETDYVLAAYTITTPVDGERAARGLAREQSICATSINGFELPRDIGSYCAKVYSVEALDGPVQDSAPLYFLNTPVYGEAASSELNSYRVRIAFPEILFGTSLTRLWNTVFGEVHRLGYLSAVKLEELALPAALAQKFRGPRHGVAGIREKLGVHDRPLFCRSMRPASGLPTETMTAINEQVLLGGFDIIKDDELTYNSPVSPFRERVQRMLEMKRRVEDKTGERKLYFANIIDDLSASLAMAEDAAELGADGVLLSTSAQGLSIIEEVGRRTDHIILSHNTCGDALTRANAWGASDAVLACLHRLAGADLAVTPGPFSTPYQDRNEAAAFLAACRENLGDCPPLMPIIQGGKQPSYLPEYTRDVGCADYMIIAATFLDDHPDGVRAAAAEFRQSWQDYQRLRDTA